MEAGERAMTEEGEAALETILLGPNVHPYLPNVPL